MLEQKARELAARIEEQFSHAQTRVLQSPDMRNAPANWFVAVSRTPREDSLHALFIHNEYEWNEALVALYVLCAR